MTHGWSIGVTHHLLSRLRGSVSYELTEARWWRTAPGQDVLLLGFGPRPSREHLHDLATSLETDLPLTDTHVYVAYRLNTGFTRREGDTASTGFDSRFDVQVVAAAAVPRFHVGAVAGPARRQERVQGLGRATVPSTTNCWSSSRRPESSEDSSCGSDGRLSVERGCTRTPGAGAGSPPFLSGSGEFGPLYPHYGRGVQRLGCAGETMQVFDGKLGLRKRLRRHGPISAMVCRLLSSNVNAQRSATR